MDEILRNNVDRLSKFRKWKGGLALNFVQEKFGFLNLFYVMYMTEG